MTDQLRAPRFLPWLRTGLATQITTPAQDGLAPHDTAAAAVAVRIRAEGPGGEHTEPVQAPVIRLRGPAEVTGIEPGQVVRHDPEPGATDAEPTFFALVEFAAPDLPWRFTPAAPGADGRLQPWIALVVAEDRDGVQLGQRGTALPALHVDDADTELPDLSQSWAWAHVNADSELADGAAAALAQQHDAFRSRLLCPRRLPAGRSWLACVVPTFEAGRRAGLGLPGGEDLGLAWARGDVDVQLPVYHSWRFATGAAGDFESLARRLRPRELPGGTGLRDLDISDPGGGLPVQPGAVISYEGALVSPAGGSRPWPARHRAATKAALRSVLNRQLRRDPTPEPYDALRDDPVVGPPAYGATQAGRRQVPAENKDQPDWLEQLNTEPQHRAVAGLGAEVVRADQEALMAAAWEHAAGLREVNHVLTNARLAWELARGTKPTLAALADPDLVQVAGPAMARLPHPGGTTVRGAVAASALPAGLVSSTFRRLTRTVRAFTLPAATATATVDAGPAASRVAASSAVTAAALGDPVGFTASWADVHPPMGAELKGDLPGGTDAAVNPPGLAAAAQVRSQGQAPGSRSREAASATVYDFPRPFVDWDNLIRYTGQADVIADLPADVRTALDPAGTIVAMLQTRITGLPADRGDDVPAMLTTQPSFTTPMSQRLLALSANYVVPGVGLIPDNTLGLLEANREFVESFLAGLNRELGREFVWREYPVRLQATWARQFWDTGPGGPADIAPIGQWAAGTALGTHPAGPAQASLVLLLKGALPRRYPDMRVYAVEAAWDGGSRREKAGGEVRLPLFAVSLGPDVRVYGFALEERQARGSTDPRRPPGWFFVLEEQPGAARFGLHAPGQGDRGKAPGNWAGLSWAHLVDDAEPLPGFVDTGGPPWLLAAGRRAGNGPDGERDAWGTDAAAMARITFQRPVRMLIHADSMLPPGPGVSRPPASLGPAEPGPAGHGPSGRCR